MKKGLLITMLLASLTLTACGGGAADSNKKNSENLLLTQVQKATVKAL